MKITIYELLGLVKDGKAPKKIKYEDEIWEYLEEEYYSCKNGRILLGDLFFNYKIQTFINDEVEIIEEPKKIEKIEIYENEDGRYLLNNRDNKIYIRCDETDFMVDKFNELIDEISNLKEK